MEISGGPSGAGSEQTPSPHPRNNDVEYTKKQKKLNKNLADGES